MGKQERGKAAFIELRKKQTILVFLAILYSSFNITLHIHTYSLLENELGSKRDKLKKEKKDFHILLYRSNCFEINLNLYSIFKL